MKSAEFSHRLWKKGQVVLKNWGVAINFVVFKAIYIKGQPYRNDAKRKGRPYFMAFLARTLANFEFQNHIFI